MLPSFSNWFLFVDVTAVVVVDDNDCLDADVVSVNAPAIDSVVVNSVDVDTVVVDDVVVAVVVAAAVAAVVAVETSFPFSFCFLRHLRLLQFDNLSSLFHAVVVVAVEGVVVVVLGEELRVLK